MQKKKTRVVPQKLEYSKDWCSWCEKKSKVKREDLAEETIEYWECGKCKLMEEYRK